MKNDISRAFFGYYFVVPLLQYTENSTFFMEDLYKKCMKNSMLVTIAKCASYIL